jgi:HK97 family phage portal protein
MGFWPVPLPKASLQRVEPAFTTQRAAAPAEQTRSEPTFDTWKRLPFFGGMTASGVTVTGDSPITHDTVLACYNVIAEGCAMLPAYLYRERGAQRKHATDHPLYEVLLSSPCPHMTAFAFWKLVFFEKLHYGNHYSLIERDADGLVVGLLPVENGLCQPFWYVDDQRRRRRAYRISAPERPQAVFLEHEVFHVQNMPLLRGADYGLYGLSIWQMYQTETIGGALATNQFANSTFRNGASLSGIVAVEGALSPEAGKEAREMVREAYAGTERAGSIGVFGGNAKFYPISQDSQKAQLLETRKHYRSVLAGLLRVTAHLINDLEKGTFTNVEHLDLNHYKHCLNPHLLDLRQTIHKDLLTRLETRSGLYVDHDEREMLRGDLKSRTEFWAQAIQNAIAKPNEAREDFNLPPDPDGDTLMMNGASVPLARVIAGPPKALTPPTGKTPDPEEKPSDAA